MSSSAGRSLLQPRREPYSLERGGGRWPSAAFLLSKRSVSLRPHGPADLAAGDAYVNVHTTNFPGGEIRGDVRSQGD